MQIRFKILLKTGTYMKTNDLDEVDLR